jgi:hypothetical protein
MFGLSWATVKLIAWGVLAATVLGFAAYVKHEWEAGKAAQAQIVVLHKQEKAVAGAEKSVVAQAGSSEQAAQAALSAQARVIIEKVPVYVQNPRGHVSGVACVSNGLVRLHDAAALGVDPASLPATVGPDDACSGVAPSDFASTIARNYAAARANAEQLNALEADVRNQADAAAGRQVVVVPPPPLASDVPY